MSPAPDLLAVSAAGKNQGVLNFIPPNLDSEATTMLEPYGERPKKIVVHNEFDVIQEISRGASYAGGKRAEDGWNGYAFGFRLVALVLAGLLAYAVLKEFVSSGDLWKMLADNF
ncbi:MAG: hypothetical protein ACUVTH_06510 [Thermogutta sp.]